ncbi:hypothetical protein [Auritidibacter ignavus]|uniref:hypothetical protein n=2 Tax=Micrococcaceae TaxID=1268 RepID=UPI0011C3E13D|nr:hypothetical protein [Auritidibacter ignavus]NIH72556.1 hypothetical protein [Auritidibacter ignavus]
MAKRSKVVVMIFAVALFLVGIFVAYQFIRGLIQPLDTLRDPFPDQRPNPAPIEEGTPGPINILFVASASRDDTSEALEENLEDRAQSLFVVHLTNSRRYAQAVAFPPQLKVPDQPFTLGEAMGATREVSTLVASIETLVDVPMDHVVLLDLNALAPLAEITGGFPDPDSEDAVLEPKQVGTLIDDSITEHGMSPTQTETVMTGMLQALSESEVRRNPGVAKDVVELMQENMVADNGLDSSELRTLMRSTSALGNITWCPLATGDGGRQANAQKLVELRERFRNDTLAECS